MDGFNYRHFRVTVTEVLRRLAAYSRREEPTPGVALQSALIPACLPGFGQQHRLAALQETIEPRLWIGNRVTTPAHFDASHNLAVVACGRRRFTLFAPQQVVNLYIGPLDFAPPALPSAWRAWIGATIRASRGCSRHWSIRWCRNWNQAMRSTCRRCGGTTLLRWSG
jgi:hypothetical protein